MHRPILTIGEWRDAQAGSEGLARLQALVAEQRRLNSPAWIALATAEQIASQWEDLLQSRHRAPQADLPLRGVPFAVKDNIDAAGFPTTAACPAFSARPAAQDAAAVARLKAAGAIVVGKTNLDQFATGLVGTRSPYGAVPCAFDPARVSGGSSSGSAVVVARGVVPFALGTDTAGSGRVPAGFNNIVGLKPTPGAISTAGVLPACRSLDCVSVFALTAADAALVLRVAEAPDDGDAYSKRRPDTVVSVAREQCPRVAICSSPAWFGDQPQERAYLAALDDARALGWQLELTDFNTLFSLARLLYEGPWVAERYAAIRDFIESVEPEAMDPTVRGIILKARSFSAADAFAAEYKRQELARSIEAVFADYDFLLVPTTPTFPTQQDIARDPVGANSQLGTYTNFVNFLGWSALSIPAGFRADGLPFGVTLIAGPWQEFSLSRLASQFLGRAPRYLGATKIQVVEPEVLDVALTNRTNEPETRVSIAVVGAHLSGLPLNKDLKSRQAVLKATIKTAAQYRLYALNAKNGIRKPGIKRVSMEDQGAKIDAEVWTLPAGQIASFLFTIPHPLGIGTIELEDGSWTLGFICELVGLIDALDITSYGGWKAYLAEVCSQPKTGGFQHNVNGSQIINGSRTANGSGSTKLIRKVLIANRGEIALRIIKTLRRMGIAAVAIYSEVDKTGPHVKEADEALTLGNGSVSDTYLNASKIIELALSVNADAVIPGYGFLSENAEFAAAVEAAGLIWIGPTPEQMRRLGLKHEARGIAIRAGVPVVPGSGRILTSVQDAISSAEAVGYPVMLKSTAGGGGIGIRRCDDAGTIEDAFEPIQQLSQSNFGNGSVFLERFVARARHIEVQIIGDGAGGVVAVGERDCSLQRRHQKLVEEAPAFRLPGAVRRRMFEAARRLAAAVEYRNVGTVEFIYDTNDEAFYFLEVNTRLQVEHPVTESVTGMDLVECMVRVAGGEASRVFAENQYSCARPVSGAAVEVRIYAESPLQQFRPSMGKILEIKLPDGVRVDTWVSKGTEMTSLYDPLIAKIVAVGQDRGEAVQKLASALAGTEIIGVETNLDYLRSILTEAWFSGGQYSTNTLDTYFFSSPAVELLEAGPGSTIQDYPGRLGLWNIGIPPSGPIDDYSARLANHLVGNAEHAPVIEVTIHGPTLLFHTDTVVAVTGAVGRVTANDALASLNEAFQVKKGEIVKIGAAEDGYRFYVAVLGGFDVPSVLGSRSTFELGKFGGHNGRKLQNGDLLHIGKFFATTQPDTIRMPVAQIPRGGPSSPPLWKIGVVPGPHGAPDYFTPAGLATLFRSTWSVHYNSNRLGIRLSGPSPEWARADGGEAGLHPSNIHDAPYSIGSVSFTGDEAVILACDGPSLGGFVVFCVVATAEMWKLGQLKPGDCVQFAPVAADVAAASATGAAISDSVREWNKAHSPKLNGATTNGVNCEDSSLAASWSPVVGSIRRGDVHISARQAGDHCMLLEFGETDGFNLAQSFAIWGFMERHRQSPIPEVQQLTPGVRTLHVDYSKGVSLKAMFRALQSHSFDVPRRLPSRRFRLPIAVDDAVCQRAVQRYADTIRQEAPWLPSNTKFLEQLNGLEDEAGGGGNVGALLCAAEFLVVGLGDVFLGSPCGVPLDPRHRLYGTKYSPSRSFTPRGAVGLGGQYMCIYGGESPGGYQLVGRTVGIWNNDALQYTSSSGSPPLAPSADDVPCKFRMFDRISFYPVSEAQLDQQDMESVTTLMEEADGVLSLDDYKARLRENQASIDRVVARRRAAFTRTPFLEQLLRLSHHKAGRGSQMNGNGALAGRRCQVDVPGGVRVEAVLPGRCFKVAVGEGDQVKAGDALLWVESNKMEMKIASPAAGMVVLVGKTNGDMVEPGDVLVVITP